MNRSLVVFIFVAVSVITGYTIGVLGTKMDNQSEIDKTLETNAEIMDTVIKINSRINAIQDDLWRVGHYTNENHLVHGAKRTLCPECSGSDKVTTQDGVDIASEIPLDEFPDNLTTVRENSEEILTMAKNIHTTLFSLKITNDIILDNVRNKAGVETK